MKNLAAALGAAFLLGSAEPVAAPEAVAAAPVAIACLPLAQGLRLLQGQGMEIAAWGTRPEGEAVILFATPNGSLFAFTLYQPQRQMLCGLAGFDWSQRLPRGRA